MRGAKIYAAWRKSAGAYYESPDAELIYDVMNRAVNDSGLKKEDIDFVISSCGEGENEAVLKFGAPYVNMKKVTGEIYGAYGAFAAVAAIEILRKKILPDGTPLEKGKYALINSVGFDGYITSFVIEGI
jgi:3-oxoacyl-(acyl-carrier-protein) synthase